MIYRFFSDKELLAIKVDFTKINETKFLTESSLPMQLSIFSFETQEHIAAHKHLPIQRLIIGTSEFIYVISGRLKVRLFDNVDKLVAETNLYDNEALLQFQGGHEFFIDAGTKFFELKQGPYLGKNKDKEYIRV